MFVASTDQGSPASDGPKVQECPYRVSQAHATKATKPAMMMTGTT